MSVHSSYLCSLYFCPLFDYCSFQCLPRFLFSHSLQVASLSFPPKPLPFSNYHSCQPTYSGLPPVLSSVFVDSPSHRFLVKAKFAYTLMSFIVVRLKYSKGKSSLGSCDTHSTWNTYWLVLPILELYLFLSVLLKAEKETFYVLAPAV